jgi:hypothetical protein
MKMENLQKRKNFSTCNFHHRLKLIFFTFLIEVFCFSSFIVRLCFLCGICEIFSCFFLLLMTRPCSVSQFRCGWNIQFTFGFFQVPRE